MRSAPAILEDGGAQGEDGRDPGWIGGSGRLIYITFRKSFSGHPEGCDNGKVIQGGLAVKHKNEDLRKMSRAAGKAGNLRDKLDGNELDLSLSDLSEIPVRDLAALPKATVLDLSCNKLTMLPGEFCSLTHIVRLDLSKNQLVQLPSEFGRLVNLQHLDLLQNRLKALPVTFAQLKSLKWLDLKDNPLNPALAKAAGDCLDEKQCKECAQMVLQYMKVVQAEQEQDLQRKLLEEQALKQKREAEQRQKEDREREQRRKQKAQQKARKRRDYNALQAAQQEMKKKKRH
ncbi:unnamed protein product [Ranitomeya imitator]|uniref:Leucine-rich repeat-containing protein 59 n=1 Tax=Ranitomeya imitator TaxID=111125 RepID=A0ABN9MJC9_9NEOB|nr:unnamed protein product [Ranitomeya imitator]